ncbi:CLUMA_CG000208, isoform A [Clunio marinus]|uniref:CLUMA_CG000208, isoform A n=1 Tax=Clunio marinus TaxID=568069 RepID=A0A1J1HF08_9DIPT|nr:CLUMA_CG000208, isoform A [Clunio marinus]
MCFKMEFHFKMHSILIWNVFYYFSTSLLGKVSFEFTKASISRKSFIIM